MPGSSHVGERDQDHHHGLKGYEVEAVAAEMASLASISVLRLAEAGLGMAPAQQSMESYIAQGKIQTPL